MITLHFAYCRRLLSRDLSRKSRITILELESAGTAIEDLVPQRVWLERNGITSEDQGAEAVQRLLEESGSPDGDEDTKHHYGLY